MRAKGFITALVGLTMSSSSGAVRAQSLLDMLPGSEGMFGQSVDHVEDVDGDGWLDLVVGAPWGNADRGVVRLISGQSGAALVTVTGDAVGDLLGHAVGRAGDVNGDGTFDFVASATSSSLLTLQAGYVRVYSGVDGAVLHTFVGGSFENFGASVAGAGDVDLDGFDDVIVGAPELSKASEGTGFARVYSGQDGSVLFTILGVEPLDLVGWDVGPAGDVDGDGHADVIIGAPQLIFTGFAVVISGKETLDFVAEQGSTDVVSDPALLTTGIVPAIWVGTGLGERFGASVACLGDVSQDGVPDFAIGAPRAISGRGAVLVFSGAGRLLWGDLGDPGDHLGTDVDGGFDFDSDGRPDVVAGAPAALLSLVGGSVQVFGAGHARAYSGRAGLLFYTLAGPQLGSEFGQSVSAGGPASAGPLPTLIVGAPNDEPSGPMSGSVWVYDGTPLTPRPR